MLRKTDYTVMVLVALNYALEAALLTHVDGFQLPPVAIFVVAVLLAPIGPVLAILPQLGVRVPSLLRSTVELPSAAPALQVAPAEQSAGLHPTP